MHAGLGDVFHNGSAGDVRNVNLILNHAEKLYAVLDFPAALHQLGAADTDFDGNEGADSFANFVNNHNGEPGPAFRATSKFIGSCVVPGGQELAGKYPVSEMQHYHVKADLNRMGGSFGVIIRHALQLFPRNHRQVFAGFRVRLSIDGIHNAVAVFVESMTGEGQKFQGYAGVEEMHGAGEPVPIIVVALVVDVGIAVHGVVQIKPVDILTGKCYAGGPAPGFLPIMGNNRLSGIGFSGG